MAAKSLPRRITSGNHWWIHGGSLQLYIYSPQFCIYVYLNIKFLCLDLCVLFIFQSFRTFSNSRSWDTCPVPVGMLNLRK